MSENVHALIRRLEEHLVAAADDADLRLRLADAYLRVGDKKNAAAQYKEIGQLRLRRVQVARGAEYLLKAAELLPNDLTVQEQLYTIYRLTEQHEKSVAIGITLADQLRRARQFARAEEILMRCLQVGGDRPEVRRVLAETYAAMGEVDKARPHLQHLAANASDERERRRFAQLLADLERKGGKPAATKERGGGAKARGDEGRGGTGGVKLAWVAAGVAAAALCLAGVSRRVSAGNRAVAVEEAAALARGGDLGAAAARLREAGLEPAAAQADRAAAAALDRTQRAELAAARAQGLAPGAEGGATGLQIAQRLAQEAGAPELRGAAESLAQTLDRAAAETDRLWRALNADDASGAFASWIALRDSGHLAGALAADPALAGREVALELQTNPPGAVVRDGTTELGTTPCTVTFAMQAGRTLTLALGELSARIDCRDTPGATWLVPLERTERWRARVRGAVTGVVRAGGALILAGADGAVAAVDAESGHERWRAELGPGGDVLGAPVVAGDWVAVMLGSGRIAAFAVADGRRGGPFDGVRTLAPPLAIGTEGALLVIREGGALVRAHAAKDGSAALTEWGRFPGARWLAAGRTQIYALSASGVAAFPARGGAARWSTQLADPLTGRLSEAGPWILVQLQAGGVAVFDEFGGRIAAGGWARRATGAAVHVGERILVGRTEGGVGEVFSALPGQANDALRGASGVGGATGMTLGGGVCYVADAGGRLHSWLPDEPAPRWSAPLPAAPSIAPFTDATRVLIGLHNGELLALAGGAR
ncbi:MAG: outer membrane protein assembly factor BamB family protein [Planctomycetota bacterium]|jgi:outer membrane protein assembly factor BamB